MCIWDNRKIDYTIEPIDAKYSDILYESASSDLVNVDENEKLKANKIGDTTVKVTIDGISKN